MQIVHDKKLLQLIKVTPPVIVIIFSFLVVSLVFNHNKLQLASDIRSIQSDYIISEKELLKAQVEQLVQYIDYEKNKTKSILKQNIKEKVYQAHSIATAIYENNIGKSEQEVTHLITNALRSIRFNDGRGYFFIYKTTGQNIMHPVRPDMKGQNHFNFQDSRGNYVTRELAQRTKQNGDAFLNWWLIKPDNKRGEFEKIVFGKHFAPYDWFIGTGEYLIDVESKVKESVAERLAKISYGENGFIFVLDYQGNVLSHYRKDFQGTNVKNNPNKQLVSIAKKIIKTAQQGEGFISYVSPLMPSTGKPAAKISFVVGFPQWGWAIGTGFYKSEMEQYLAKRTKTITKQNQKQLVRLFGLSVAAILFFICLSALLTKYLARRFTLYENKINGDFDELNKVKLELQYQALHDSLTKLPNRTLLDEQISRGITLSQERNKNLAVMFVDLDDFKKTNDVYGHSVGDKLLELLGKKFNTLIKKYDFVARFGGDEFIFCFPLLACANEAQKKVKDIQNIFKQEFIIKGKSIYSSCSIGVAMYPTDANIAEDLVSKADIVLYKSKAAQKGCSLFFNDDINNQVQRDFHIEAALRVALDKNELDVFYQPQISVKTGLIFGVEALVRWNSKTLGAVSPDEFIKLAEDIGIISQIGNFVMEKAIMDIKKFNLENNHTLQLSINVSPKQLIEPNFAADTLSTIERVGFDYHLVTIEVTENVFISDFNIVIPVLDTLRSRGIKLSLDDFGTGYSSLSYLGNLPMDEIKIDRSFIDKLLVSRESESLVKTIIAIGQFYNFIVVAEGVETKEQYEQLEQYDCDIIQGYFFDRPLPLAEFFEKYQCH